MMSDDRWASNKVVIELSADEALALFEWSYRFMETGRLEFTHPADPVVIDRIAAILEKSLSEPFSPEYSALLRAARSRVVAAYRARMSESGSAWLGEFTYADGE